MRALAALVLLHYLALCFAGANLDLDPYDVLGIDESATAREVKAAYRKLSLATHPDKAGGDVEAFKEISHAYEILSDGEKRALFDAGGMAAVEKGTGGKDPWGRPTGVPKGGDSTVTVTVPLEDLYKGGSVHATIHRRIVCRGCSDRARSKRRQRQKAELDKKCEGCGPSCPFERKIVQRRMGHMIMNQEVQQQSAERCKTDAKVLTATIERGAPEGTEITFARASEQKPGVIPGDVKLRLKAARHAVFSRNGTTLHMEMQIQLRDALLGFERTIQHLDGHPVQIANKGISQHGQVLILKGEGMPRHGVPSEYGDLAVKLSIRMPSELTAAERAFVGSNFEPVQDRVPG